MPESDDRSTLARLVSEGRAVAPTSTGPAPMPPRLGDDVDAAEALAALRDEERW